MPKPPFSLPKAPGQHEDILKRLDQGFKAILDALSKQTGTTVLVHLDTSVQDKILDIVKDIRHHQAADSVTKAEIDEILGPVLARMKAVP